jgi:hypothetical protein
MALHVTSGGSGIELDVLTDHRPDPAGELHYGIVRGTRTEGVGNRSRPVLVIGHR